MDTDREVIIIIKNLIFKMQKAVYEEINKLTSDSLKKKMLSLDVLNVRGSFNFQFRKKDLNQRKQGSSANTAK